MLQITVHTVGLRREDSYSPPRCNSPPVALKKNQTQVTPRIRTVARGTQDIPLAGIGGKKNPDLHGLPA
jgi:hypothetical protein